MQLFLNFAYTFLSFIFSAFEFISAPPWLIDLMSGMAKFVIIANYYFPVDTALYVVLGVVIHHITLMVISAMLQLF